MGILDCFLQVVSGMTELKADDRVGIIFCMIIASLQVEGKQILMQNPKIDDEKYCDILYVFEAMLCYRAWLKLDKYWKQ